MLPSEVIVEAVEVARSRPTLVVRFDNALHCPSHWVWCIGRCICHRKDQVYCPFPLSVALQCGNGESSMNCVGTPDCVARRYPDFRWFSQVALAPVDIFHAVTATEEHVRHGWHYLVPLVAVVGGAADTKNAVDDFVKWKCIKSLACVINPSERSDFSGFMFTFAICRIFFILVLSSTKVSELPDICKHWIIYCYPMTCFLTKL